MRITHRVGHALTTKGKQSPDGVKEWAQAEPIAKLVIAELNNYEGVVQKRIDDPTGKVDKPLNTLVAEVNALKADVHIDYHLNAHGNGATWTTGNGTEVFVNTKKPKEAVELATKVLNNIVSVTGFRNRGVKYYDWAMVTPPRSTNILIEICFMTNKSDVSIVRSTDGKIKIAAAIVDAIVTQYKLKRKQQPKQEQPKKEGVFWDDTQMKQGQIGRISILKPINLWKRVSVCSVEDCEYCKDKQPELKFERILQPGERYRVYGYDGFYGGQYNVGGGCYITNMEDYVKYETPSKAKIQELQDYYKK